MKVNKYIISALVCPFVLGSCADWDDWKYDVEKPQTIAQYEYLNDYAPLKEYLDRGAHPGFKVSAALAVDEFNQQGPLFRLAAHNFDEIVAGNAMKMASCVNDQGEMDFSKVSSFVRAAEDAGLTVYGHTLAWHAQQPSKYLNGLIADKEIEVDPDAQVEKTDYALDCSTLSSYDWTGSPASVKTEWNKGGAVVITNPEPIDPFYELQYWLVNGISLKTGTTYKITFLCKAEGESPANIRFKLGNWGDGYKKDFTIPVGGDYEEVSFEVTPTMDSNGLFFQHGDFAGKIYWKSIKITHSEAPSIEIFTDCISNGEMKTGGDMSNFVVREPGKGDVAGTPIAGGPDGKNCVVVHANANAENEWDTQFFIYTPNKTWSAGDKYKITFYYKASENIDADTQCHGEPGTYKHYACLSPNPSFTTQWQKYEANGTIPAEGDGMKAIAFNLNKGKKDHAIDYYFADIHWGTVEMGNKKPLTPDEKKDILTLAMNKWISGMMQATEGKVKAWDLINEAVSGGGNVNGFYALQTEATSEHNPQDFYWQDYFTPEMYGPIVEKAARDAYAAVEGTNPEDLKLFINDYNLESDWDDNKKVKSLVYWIGVWEKKGQELGWNTKIDGIGSQMHISYYENEQTLESKKRAIQNMLKIMAETGKLVRISEIDMGYVDKDGKDVTTAQLEKLPIEERVAKEKAMAEHYKWIIEQYFKIVPVSQQYGICQWCLTDSPANSSWRGGQPVGLWNLNYQRKPAYGGFADGLASSAKGESDVK